MLRQVRRNPFMPKSRLLAFVIKELREVWPPTVFFAVGFNLIVQYLFAGGIVAGIPEYVGTHFTWQLIPCKPVEL
jgi:hypothetical protein